MLIGVKDIMNILVIAGYCLRINSSANLCHISYINGLLNSGHTVDLITVSDKNLMTDNSMLIPPVRHLYEYQASYYEQYSRIRRNSAMPSTGSGNQFTEPMKGPRLRSKLKSKIKKTIRAMYGVYGPDAVWEWRARKFRTQELYDVVISLAYPPTSHRLAERLIRKKHIATKHWLQIWEDPWYADLFGVQPNEKIRKEEARLLSVADRVCYVSPLTLHYQKQFYGESAHKMFWKPLPSYYVPAKSQIPPNQFVFGYFGDYNSKVRNLYPFYQVAVEQNLETYICGNTDRKFSSTNDVHVFGRLPLRELHPYEDKTNVLVFVCNLKGGQIPGKIYQYSTTDKYILFILDGTQEETAVLKEYFGQFNRYFFCDNTIESISAAVQSIIHHKSQNIINAPVEAFRPENIISSILKETML